MNDKMLYDINEVCSMLGTTSRTLRFYEEKGIISSTKEQFSLRRKYTYSQLNHIKNVIVLRAIGLSVEAIKRLQKNGTDLKKEIISKRAEIYALLDSKNKEISLLNEALAIVENGEDIFKKGLINNNSTSMCESIVEICSQAVVNGHHDILYKYFSKKLAEYLPISVYETIRKDTLEPLGDFVGLEKIEPDKAYSNVFYQYVKYTMLGLKIKLVFHNGKIDGFWLGYYKI